MEDQTQHQVMTEIALALAMVFFSLMVLALVSVGINSTQPQLMSLTDSKPAEENIQQAPGFWVIYHAGTFYDRELKTIEPGQLQQGPIWLAVPPDMDLQQLIRAKAQIFSSDVSIAILDQPWLIRLEQLK